MGKWFPFLYDLGMKPLEKKSFRHIREVLLSKANGRVLEIGSGSGINFPFYQKVQRVDAIEPNISMIEKAKKRLEKAAVPIYTHVQQAENLQFPDDSFDTVVSTLVFCTIPDPKKALREIRRVGKRDATFLFFEHIKMEQRILAKTQDLLTPMWRKICDGCHLNRDTLNMIKTAGFQVEEVKYYYKGLFIVVVCTIAEDSSNDRQKIPDKNSIQP